MTHSLLPLLHSASTFHSHSKYFFMFGVSHTPIVNKRRNHFNYSLRWVPLTFPPIFFSYTFHIVYDFNSTNSKNRFPEDRTCHLIVSQTYTWNLERKSVEANRQKERVWYSNQMCNESQGDVTSGDFIVALTLCGV
jgi:hypothetical protein